MWLASTIDKIQWHHNTALSVFFLLFFCLFISLGYWQLQRAEEKRLLHVQFVEAQTIDFSPLEILHEKSLSEFDRIELRGSFDSQVAWALANQHVNGRVGFDIIAPFITMQGQSVLVNLGWQKNNNLDNWFATVNLLEKEIVNLTGSLRRPADLPFVSNLFSGEFSSVVELVPEQFPYPGLSKAWFIQIDAAHPLALVTHWHAQRLSASKHTGYAVQWFAMAGTLALLFIFASSNVLKLLTSEQRCS